MSVTLKKFSEASGEKLKLTSKGSDTYILSFLSDEPDDFLISLSKDEMLEVEQLIRVIATEEGITE